MNNYMLKIRLPRRGGHFLKRYTVLKLIHEELESQNRPISNKEIELVIKKPHKEKPRPRQLYWFILPNFKEKKKNMIISLDKENALDKMRTFSAWQGYTQM